MQSERTIGAAVRYLVENKNIDREELFISSKNGYIPDDFDNKIN